ncbi:putative GTP-binding protein 6 [Saccostrea cucullata]|uniref:putative GTP-binding protein 6 n=1 Tax=Saccostrea cuccullata TaxID=36930 RepID=UPI002ED56E65
MFSRFFNLTGVCQLCRMNSIKKPSKFMTKRTSKFSYISTLNGQKYTRRKDLLSSAYTPVCCFSTSRTVWKPSDQESSQGEEDLDSSKAQALEIPESDDVLQEDEEYEECLQEHFHFDGVHHSLMVIHPAIRWGREKPRSTTPELQLSEACALVHSLPKWRVADTKIIKVKSHRGFIFMKGQLEELTKLIKSRTDISAVFVNVDVLKINQVAMLQGSWKLPVFDRYTLVLHIFKEYAQTREAKLQIALAEIPYIRGRLEQINEGQHDHLTGKTHYVVSGGFRFTYIQKRQALVSARERRLRGELEKVKQQREILRKNRIKQQYPTVAVVGYTNCGKTTLIKALTEDESLTPENRLFATLDVTVHQAYLANIHKVLFIDTVGFISDIPDSLMDAFSATLEDALIADVILHVRDSSHPDLVAQNENVIDTLGKLLPEEKLQNMLVVNNKCDLLSEYESSEDLYISAVTGTGIIVLKKKLEETIIKSTGRMRKTFRIPVGGEHLSWLYKNATVLSTRDGEDGHSYLVETIINTAAYEKFKHLFSKNKRKS